MHYERQLEDGLVILSTANVMEEFVARFPALKPSIDGFYTDGTQVEPFIGLTMVFMHEYALPALDRDDPLDEAKLIQVFKFVEEMASSGDPDLENIVEVGICEVLGDDARRLERSRSLIGAATLALSHSIERSLGRE